MFKRFRRRPPPQPPHEPDQAEFDSAWADYVEWSGLDESGLPGPRPEGDNS